jgi:hypothetical protein
MDDVVGCRLSSRIPGYRPCTGAGQSKKDEMIDRPTYRLDLRPEPDVRVPDAIRLRKLLKALLRGYGFRAVAIKEMPANALKTAQD